MSAHYCMVIINQILGKNDTKRPVLLHYSVIFFYRLAGSIRVLLLDVVVIVPTYVSIRKNFSYIIQISFVRF